MKNTPGNAEAQILLGTENKAEAVVKHCVYMMATGKWLPGHKLPSVRQAEQEWGLNRLTVQKAYQQLVEQGLAECRVKSGYYVSEQGATRKLSQHRYELENLYDNLIKQIRKSSNFSPLAVFRYMSRLSEIRAADRPDCAFVECTAIQSKGHAHEIRTRLGVPVAALTTEEVARGPDSLPREVRIVFTTLFHYDELTALKNDPRRKLVTVPIEVSPTLVEEIGQRKGKSILLETEESMARHIARDALDILRGNKLEVEVVSDLDQHLKAYIERRSSDRNSHLLLLSPRHWGSVDSSVRQHSFIRQIKFSITEGAWPEIAQAIGLPLGGSIPL